MDEDRPVPWFPAWGVRFPEPVENVFSVVSVVNDRRPSNRWLMIAYEAAASEVHLWTAWHAMRGNEESGSMVAKTPDTEFMRLLSGTHQIYRAFERAGVAVGDEAAWVVFLPDFGLGEGFGDVSIPQQTYNDNSEEAIRLIEHLGGSLLAKRPVPSLAGLERVGASYPEDPSFPQMEEAFLGHTALSDLR